MATCGLGTRASRSRDDRSLEQEILINLLGTAVGALCCFSLADPVTAQPGVAPQTRAELLAGVRSYHGAIATLRVTYTCNMLVPMEQHVHAREHQTIPVKGDRMHWDVTYGRRADIDPATYHKVVTFNGQQSTYVDMTRG